MKICYKPIICLRIGIIIFVVMGFFPPWKLTHSNEFKGYNFLLCPVFIAQRTTNPYLTKYESPEEISKIRFLSRSCLQIDTTVLYVQWITVAVMTGGLFLAFQEKKKDLTP
jgi:hypothetical protein